MNKKKFTDQSETNTAITLCIKKEICPHWSPPSRSCLLVKDGLFLPVNQHVATYCLTSHYPSCFQYQKLAGAANEVGPNQTGRLNRRRSIRIPSRHLFHFSEITGNNQIPGLREDDAWTIDCSDHGIRFASRHPLSLESAIRFFLEEDNATANLAGTGRVIWCYSIENTPLFHTGIVFTGQTDSTSPL